LYGPKCHDEPYDLVGPNSGQFLFSLIDDPF
jgi:hypothetical protein